MCFERLWQVGKIPSNNSRCKLTVKRKGYATPRASGCILVSPLSVCPSEIK